MNKKKVIFRTGVILLVVVGIFMCAVLVTKSNSLYAESKDGLWRAYIVKDTGVTAGGYHGYLFYYGNRQGDIGEIHIKCLADSKETTSRLKAGSHTLGPIERFLVGHADREGYAFQETRFKEMKGSSLSIVWNESGEERYSSLIF